MRHLNNIPDFGAEVNAYRNSRKRQRATGAEVVLANAHLWAGYARADAQFELAAARVTEMHNRDLEPEHHVKVATVERAFQKTHFGWKAYRKSVISASSPAIAGREICVATTAPQPAVSLSDHRPVGGRTFGEPSK